MKRCPECRRDYYDDTLLYCLDDGSALLEGPDTDDPATAILNSAVLPSEAPTIHQVSGTDLTAIMPRADSRTRNANSIAVLPFANLSSDAENEYFCDGLAELLLNALAKIDDLKVAARTSAFSFKGKNTTVAEIGKVLNVNAILEGSVRKAGHRVRITVQLINASGGFHLWSAQYDRQLTDIFDIQEEISLSIVKALKLKLFRDEEADLLRRRTDNTEAYQLYLRGRYYWHKRTADALAKGLEFFDQAIQHDSNYAIAYTGVSDSYTLLVVREAITPEEGFAKAKSAAVAALNIDPSLAEAHASLGHAMLHNWEWEAGAEELRTAIELNPRYSSSHHWYSEYLTAMGRCVESITELKLAGELDPLALIIRADLGRAFYYARQFDQVVQQETGTLEMDPGFWLSHINLGRSFTQKRLHDKALAELQKAREILPENTEILSFLGFAYAAADKQEEALRLLDELLERSGKGYVPPYHFAILYAGLGDKDQAFERLEQAYDRHAVDLFTLKVEPMLSSLRSDPRFADLVQRVGLPE